MTVEESVRARAALILRGTVLIAMLLPLASGAGCFMPALAAAPLALRAGEAVGAGVLNGAASHSGNDVLDRDDRCDELEQQTPMAVELRVDDSGPTAWRELTLVGPADAPRWQPLIDPQSDRRGWRQVSDLGTMEFAPPLGPSLKAGDANYLAYAPSAPRSPVEQAELVALQADFGGGSGTFQWHGRSYQYTLVNKLPCFPASALARR